MLANPNFEPILRWLSELSQNNNKAWFQEHRPEYEAARDTFGRFISGLIDEFREADQLHGLTVKECVYRINRDIRFSKDKSPYNTSLTAYIAPGGRKATKQGYYIAVSPAGQSMVAGGMYRPSSEQLGSFRKAIDRDAAAFKKIIQAPSFVETFGAIEGERLKTTPRGYDRAHLEIELLRLKQITAIHHFSDQDLLANDFPGQVIAVCRMMKPFLAYLDDILQ